jgi:hypothetical protein
MTCTPCAPATVVVPTSFAVITDPAGTDAVTISTGT